MFAGFFDNRAQSRSSRTDAEKYSGSWIKNPLPLKIWQKSTFGPAHGMRDIVPGGGLFPSDLTYF